MQAAVRRPSEIVGQLGDYEVREELGHGGMATVHRAIAHGDSGFAKPVALKRLLPHLASNLEFVQSFAHEARLASHLHHANVVQTLDFGKAEGTYFIAMEYVAGPTLNQILRQCATAAGAMPVPIVVAILCQICDGLDHAHSLCDEAGRPLGIVHRDVTPSNIIVSSAGIVKLIDFGIAKARTGQMTQAGVVKGKFRYMAPEYTIGLLDHRADLFAVGVIAHELLSSRPLFWGRNDLELVTRLREMPIQPPSRWNAQVTRDLDDIVMTALQRDPDKRWQNASAMRSALGNVARDLGVVVGPRELTEWVEWAFTQESRGEDSGLARVIDDLDQPSCVSIEYSVPLAPQPAQPEPYDSTVKLTAQDWTGVTVVPATARSSGVMIFLLLMLTALAVVGYRQGASVESVEAWGRGVLHSILQ